MNIPVTAGIAPADTPPAPKSARDSQGPNGANDLFGDLLRGQFNAIPPAPTPASDSRDTPPPASNSHDDDNTQAANSGSDSVSSASAQQSSDASKDTQKTASSDKKNTGKTDDKDGDKRDTDKKDAANPQAAAVPTAVAAVIAALTDTAPPAATQTDGTDAGTPATPAVPAAAQAMPLAPAVETIPAPPVPGKDDQEGKQDGKSDKPGTGPVNAQVSVTDDSKYLVSRPQATLAPTQPADAPAHEDNKPQAADNQAPAPTPADGTKPDAASVAKPANTDKTDSQQTADAAGPVTLPHVDPGAPSHKSANDPAVQSQPQVAANAAPAALPVHANAPTDPASQIQNLMNTPRAAAVPTAASTTFDQVAVQITKAAADGLDKISIQLKPESLGRIDVQLQVTHDGRVNATIGAHRQDTLDLLQRDSRSLERALNDAGLRADAGSLSFNLSGQGNDGTPASYTPSAPSTIAGGTELDPIAAVNAATLASDSAAARGGVDIRV